MMERSRENALRGTNAPAEGNRGRGGICRAARGANPHRSHESARMDASPTNQENDPHKELTNGR